MSLYDNGYPTVYDELKTYYPVWYRDVAEMDAILSGLGGQLDTMQNAIDTVIDNCYVDTMGAVVLGKVESVLGISYDSPRTLAERRKMVKSYFIGFGKISATRIKEIVGIYTTSPVVVTLANSLISVVITRDENDTFELDDCYFVIARRIPAHLALAVSVDSPIGNQVYVGLTMTKYKEVEI